jgi:hypothetical protein
LPRLQRQRRSDCQPEVLVTFLDGHSNGGIFPERSAVCSEGVASYAATTQKIRENPDGYTGFAVADGQAVAGQEAATGRITPETSGRMARPTTWGNRRARAGTGNRQTGTGARTQRPALRDSVPLGSRYPLTTTLRIHKIPNTRKRGIPEPERRVAWLTYCEPSRHYRKQTGSYCYNCRKHYGEPTREHAGAANLALQKL